MIKKIAHASIPSDTVDTVLDFIDTIWTDLVEVLLLALIEMIWDLVVNIFIDLAPAWGFALVMFFWCYMFYWKYIGSPR